MLDLNLELPHRRFNPLTREWVLVSPNRAKRPWLGQVDKPPVVEIPPYDPDCYLCPGNQRVSGARNPDYRSTFVFDNDFQALLTPERSRKEQEASGDLTGDPGGLTFQHQKENSSSESDLFIAEPEFGLSRVVCFSPRHDLSIPRMRSLDVEAVVKTWTDQTRMLGELDFISYVQVFENNGAMMGASNPHPHSQIWAASSIPNEPAKEISAQTHYLQRHNACLVCEVLKEEQQRKERVVVANEAFTALVPFWAIWPFEVLLVANRHCGSLMDLSPDEVTGLAAILQAVTTRFDNLFEVPFPYSMGFHQAPFDGQSHEECHLHAHYYPPLLRSATVRKFMVGYEMLAMPQRDLTPETSAQRLRGLSAVHYRSRADDENIPGE